MAQLRKATRQKVKIRLGLSAPSGAGKTYSALLIAKGLSGDLSRVAVIDTENGSADIYEHLGEYNVLPITAPYTPEKYIEAIKECYSAGMEVIIIDSVTHEWSGKGGCLDAHQEVVNKQRQPNSFTAWAEITPRHQAFIDTILQAPCHIITTVRSKSDYVMQEKNGKQAPVKVGMAAQTRDGFEYELTISLDLDVDHKAFASKDRTGLFMDKPTFIPTEQTGILIKEWCESGVDVVAETKAAIDKVNDCQTVDALKTLRDSLSPLVISQPDFIGAAKARYSTLSNPTQ